jgi:hypothetical protein
MKKQIFSIFVLAAFCLNFAPLAFAQASVNDWSNVQKLKLGTYLIIEPKAGKAIKASLEGVGSAEIMVYSGKKFLTFNKDSVARIYRSRGGSEQDAKDKGAGIGMLAGYAAGLAFPPGLLIFLAGTGVGLLIGKEEAKKKRKGRLIYEPQ